MKNLETKYALDWQDKSFLKTLPKHLKSLSVAEQKEVEQRFVEIFNQEKENISDRQSQSHQMMCAYVLAAYEFLVKKSISKEKIIAELTVALKNFGGKYIQWSMKIMLWLKRDKQKIIENAAIQKSRSTYGNSFEMEEEKEVDQFTSIVTKCAYFDFFKRKGVPELTKIFCEWDALWADEINKQNCGIRFNRPTTIADHKENCRFEFHYQKQ